MPVRAQTALCGALLRGTPAATMTFLPQRPDTPFPFPGGSHLGQAEPTPGVGIVPLLPLRTQAAGRVKKPPALAETWSPRTTELQWWEGSPSNLWQGPPTSATCPASLTHFSPGWTVPAIRTFSLIRSRDRPARHLVITILHRDSHGSLFFAGAFKYLKIALMPLLSFLAPYSHFPFSRPHTPVPEALGHFHMTQ